jgi:hypothetical protein
MERIKDMEEAIATRYNQNRRGSNVVTTLSELKNPIQRLEEYARLAIHQVENVYLTQVQENLDIDFDTRKKLALDALDFIQSLQTKLASIQVGSTLPGPYLTEEKLFVRSVELKLISYAHIIELLENNRGQKRVLQAFAQSRQSEALALSSSQFNKGLANQAKEYCSLIARACLKKDGKVILMGKADYEGIDVLAKQVLEGETSEVKLVDLIDVRKTDNKTYERSNVKQYLPVRKAMEIMDCRTSVSISK